MAVSVETLIADTRLTSGLRNNRLFSDIQIASILSDGYADLRDRLIVRFAAWFKAEFDFTLTDQDNVLDMSLVPDFQMAQGLDFFATVNNPISVPMLDSFAERNQYNNLWPLGVGWSYNGLLGRRYWIDGDTLTVYPRQNAGGNYRLIYTPMLEALALPVAREFAVTASDVDQPFGWTFNNGNFVANDVGSVITPTFTTATRQFAVDPADNDTTPSHWSFANGNFVAGDVGGTITPAFDAPNTAFNVTYTIVTVLSSTFIEVTPDPQGFGTFTGPAAGTATVSSLSNAIFNVPYTITAVLSGQQIEVTPDPQTLGTFATPPSGTASVASPQPGTIAALPQPLTPWAKYLVLYASLVIRTSRQQQTQDLELQFQQMQARVTAATKQRSEGIRQAPITRGWGGYGGGGWR